MAQALYFTVLLAMLIHVCFASGDDFSIECPDRWCMATPKHNETATIKCTFKKSAFSAVCNGGTLPTQVQFQLKNKLGSKLPWCYADTSPCPSSGAVQSTGSSLPSSCGCVTDDGTYMTFTMTIYPSFDLQGSSFTCEAACLTTGTLPALVDKSGKGSNIQLELCGLPEFKFCSKKETLDSETLECHTSIFFTLCWVFLIWLIICVIIIVSGAVWYIIIHRPKCQSNQPGKF